MSMVCPQCKKAFEQLLECPDCQVRMDYHARSFDRDAFERDENDQWQETPGGRVLVGLLVAQGLGYALQQLISAGFLIWGDDNSREFWNSLGGYAFLHALQGACLVLGATLAGAGQTSAILFGSFIGLFNGIIFALLQKQGEELLPDYLVFAQPVVHLIFGAFGGWLGARIWKPAPPLQFGTAPTQISSFSWASLNPFQFFQGPIHWRRVLIAIVPVVAGALYSKRILRALLDWSEGGLKISSHLQNKVILYEILALVTFVGAMIAGSSTFNGLKQGLCVGVGATMVLVGMQMGNPTTAMDVVIFQSIIVMAASLAGGWFGGKLFPPLGGEQRKRIADI